MIQITTWLKRAYESCVHPDRELRVGHLATYLEHSLVAQGDSFVLATALAGSDYSVAEIDLARERLYERALDKGWRDGHLSIDEQESARWLAKKLEISRATACAIDLHVARSHFATALGQAMVDGVLDASEEARLSLIAGSVGCTLSQFARGYFQTEGETFLRGIFATCVADGRLSKNEWNYLLSVAQRLGLSHEQLVAAIKLPAQRLTEQVIRDSWADGKLSDDESATLDWLSSNLGISREFRERVVAACRPAAPIAISVSTQSVPALMLSATPQNGGLDRIEISGPGDFGVEVVGESKYQVALEILAGGRKSNSAECLTTAAIVPEDTNPYDENAVRIDIGGRVVGYLSRSDAKKYRRNLNRASLAGRTFRCRAMIVGGWYRDAEDWGHFGVKLDLPPLGR